MCLNKEMKPTVITGVISSYEIMWILFFEGSEKRVDIFVIVQFEVIIREFGRQFFRLLPIIWDYTEMMIGVGDYWQNK